MSNIARERTFKGRILNLLTMRDTPFIRDAIVNNAKNIYDALTQD